MDSGAQLLPEDEDFFADFCYSFSKHGSATAGNCLIRPSDSSPHRRNR